MLLKISMFLSIFWTNISYEYDTYLCKHPDQFITIKLYEDGILNAIQTRTYNNNKLISVVNTDNKFKKIDSISLVYDLKGNCIIKYEYFKEDLENKLNVKWSLQNETTFSYDEYGRLIDTHQKLKRPEAFFKLYYESKLSDSLQLFNKEFFEFEYASNACSNIDRQNIKVSGDSLTLLTSICNIDGDLFDNYGINLHDDPLNRFSAIIANNHILQEEYSSSSIVMIRTYEYNENWFCTALKVRLFWIETGQQIGSFSKLISIGAK